MKTEIITDRETQEKVCVFSLGHTETLAAFSVYSDGQVQPAGRNDEQELWRDAGTTEFQVLQKDHQGFQKRKGSKIHLGPGVGGLGGGCLSLREQQEEKGCLER